MVIDWSAVKAVKIPEGDCKRVAINGTIVWEKGGLPSEYQQVEYIESTGAQYIDTKVQGNNSNQIMATFMLAERALNAKRNYLFSVIPSGNGRTQFSYSKNAFFGWGNAYNNTATINTNTDRHNVIIDRDAFKLDDNVVYRPTSNSFTQTYNIFMFASNSLWSGNISDYADGLIVFSALIINYDTKAIIRNFVPCYRIADGEIGMYDLVNGVFYTNQGSGTFIKGEDV